jgi:hypothetical protein
MDPERQPTQSVAAKMSEIHRNHLTLIMVKLTEKEVQLLKEEHETKQRMFHESTQRRINQFSTNRELHGAHQRQFEETQNKLSQNIRARMTLDQEIRAKSQLLNAFKQENRKLMDNLNSLWGLRGFLDSISPAYYLEKKEADT